MRLFHNQLQVKYTLSNISFQSYTTVLKYPGLGPHLSANTDYFKTTLSLPSSLTPQPSSHAPPSAVCCPNGGATYALSFMKISGCSFYPRDFTRRLFLAQVGLYLSHARWRYGATWVWNLVTLKSQRGLGCLYAQNVLASPWEVASQYRLINSLCVVMWLGFGGQFYLV